MQHPFLSRTCSYTCPRTGGRVHRFRMNYFRMFEYNYTNNRSNTSCSGCDTSNEKNNDAFETEEASRQELFSKPIHILGAGSIGLFWASSIRLNFPSYPVRVIRKTPKMVNFVKKGLMNVSIQRRFDLYTDERKRLSRPRMVQVPFLYHAVALPEHCEPIQNLIVCTKAYQAVNAVESLINRIDEATHVILLCNGALAVKGDLDLLFSQYGKQPKFHGAITTHGVYRELDKQFSNVGVSMDNFSKEDESDCLQNLVHAGNGATFLEEFPEMAGLWEASGLNCQSISSLDFNRQLWFKLCANCVINPLSLLYGCVNGDLPKIAVFKTLRDEITQEVAKVYVAAQSLPSIHNNTFDHILPLMQNYVDTVIRSTAQNKSSMLQDFLAQRPTEIDYLTGFIVRKGNELGISCRRNEELLQKAKLHLESCFRGKT